MRIISIHRTRLHRKLVKMCLILKESLYLCFYSIDLLAVPEFTFGAMENWGLVTFREDRLIYDEKIVSTEQKQDLGETIAHELAHFCTFLSYFILPNNS